MHDRRISLPVNKPHPIIFYDSLLNTNSKCSLDIKDRNKYREKELEKIQSTDEEFATVKQELDTLLF